MSKTVCVIGAGVSGLNAVKACIEEGLEPTCYERGRGYGSIWNYNIFERNQRACVYKSMVTNVSKEASCFSDFPYPKEYTPYFSHTKFFEYLESYVTHFDLEKHVTLNTEVESVVQTSDEAPEKRKWKVTSRNSESGIRKTKEFDCVIVCTGLNSAAKMPNIPGLTDGSFEGRVLHSCEYDRPEEFRDKTVVVIGLGSSGADIATDISDHTQATFLSTRSGAWIVPRIAKRGLPPDLTVNTRVQAFLRTALPEFVGNWVGSRILNSMFNHDILGLRCRHGPMTNKAEFLVSDNLPSKIFSGKVVVKPNVSRLDGREVYFTDGSKVDADVVICATGYGTKFPFISDEILPNDRSELRLFEWMIPFEIPNPGSLAVVGLTPFAGGSSFVSFECQARYVAQIISGVKKLPAVEEMKRRFEEVRSTLPGEGESFRFQTKAGFAYQDRVAKLTGTFPYFWPLFFRDPRLAIAVYTGPFMSYHYRLCGRHQWSGARERILNAIPNTIAGLKSIHHAQK